MSRSQVPIALPIIWIALNRLLVEGNHVRTLCPCCRRLCQTAHIPDLWPQQTRYGPTSSHAFSSAPSALGSTDAGTPRRNESSTAKVASVV